MQLTDKKISEFKEQLPRGFWTKIQEKAPCSSQTLNMFFKGKLTNQVMIDKILLAGLELIEEKNKAEKELSERFAKALKQREVTNKTFGK